MEYFDNHENVSIFGLKYVRINGMKYIKLSNMAGLSLILLLTSCMSDKVWERRELQQISDYLKTIPDSAYVLKPSGLYFFELHAGTGLSPDVNDTTYFNYKGTFLNGVAFDSVSTVKDSYGYIIGSGLIVSGVDEGLKYMKEGGKAKLLTPSKLAYRREGLHLMIPGYTPLLWEIELVKVKRGPGK
jgi:peptidyl-prolyl cis-trans isomerase A (cyclophilin A)